MKKMRTLMTSALAILFVGATATVATSNTATTASAATGDTYSAKTYVPDKYDMVDYYSGAGDIDPVQGDGVTTFAHGGLVTPLEGANIQLDTQFMLLSKKSVEEGGDGIDGWVTYSFSAAPADITSDKTYPYYGATTAGYFMHITNYSGTSAPNCVEVQFVKMEDGGATTTVFAEFVDNAQNTPITISLKEDTTDGKYDLNITRKSDGANLKSKTDLALDKSLFVNGNGQTFFSTAIYEADGCDGDHWDHRGVAVFSVQAYSLNVNANTHISLSNDSFEYTGNAHTPTPTVTIDGKTLVNGEDYNVEYKNNTEVGTATAEFTFYGVYGGNVVEKEFTITEASVPETPNLGEGETGGDQGGNETTNPDQGGNENEGGNDNAGTEDKKDDEKKSGGCSSVLSIGSAVLTLLAVGGAVIAKKRK